MNASFSLHGKGDVLAGVGVGFQASKVRDLFIFLKEYWTNTKKEKKLLLFYDTELTITI